MERKLKHVAVPSSEITPEKSLSLPPGFLESCRYRQRHYFPGRLRCDT